MTWKLRMVPQNSSLARRTSVEACFTGPTVISLATDNRTSGFRDDWDCRYICIIQPQWVHTLSFQCGSFNSCGFNILTDRTALFSSSLTMYKQVKEKYTYINSVTEPHTVYPKKYAHGFCFTVLCCGYMLTDFPISIRLTSLALWQSNDCPSASKTTLMNMDKYFMWIHYERLHNHNKAKHNKTVCIFLGIYCIQIFTSARARLLCNFRFIYFPWV